MKLFVVDKIYVSWWFKLDKCHWKGPSYPNTDPIRTTGKFAFLRMNEDPASAYYFTMNGGELREAALSANKWNNLWEEKYGRPSLWLNNKTADPWGADGKWHKLSFFIGNILCSITPQLIALDFKPKQQIA